MRSALFQDHAAGAFQRDVPCGDAGDHLVVPGVRPGVHHDGRRPGTSTVTLVLTTYNAAFKEYNMGYASAVAMLMFVFVLAVSGLQKLLLKGGED